jgi:hypothetical protein
MGLELKDRQDLWSSVDRSMFHFECQRDYGTESETLRAWLNDPTSVPSLRDAEPGFDGWLDMVESHVARGVTVSRVRVYDWPMTDYQRFEAHFARENLEAGETIRVIDRRQAEQYGILPAAGPCDWWILDDSTVLVQPFVDGRVEGAFLIDDPVLVGPYLGWRRDLVAAATAVGGN